MTNNESFVIKVDGIKTQVFVNGQEIRGITEVKFKAKYDEFPQLDLKLFPVKSTEGEKK